MLAPNTYLHIIETNCFRSKVRYDGNEDGHYEDSNVLRIAEHAAETPTDAIQRFNIEIGQWRLHQD